MTGGFGADCIQLALAGIVSQLSSVYKVKIVRILQGQGKNRADFARTR